METYATEAQQLAQDSCRKVLFPVVAENICRKWESHLAPAIFWVVTWIWERLLGLIRGLRTRQEAFRFSWPANIGSRVRKRGQRTVLRKGKLLEAMSRGYSTGQRNKMLCCLQPALTSKIDENTTACCRRSIGAPISLPEALSAKLHGVGNILQKIGEAVSHFTQFRCPLQSLTKVAASAPPLHSRTFKAATCRMPQHAAAIFILNVHPRRSSHVDVDPRVNSTSYPFLILSHFLCIFSANVVCSSSIVELWTGRLIGFHQFHPTCYRMPSNVWPRLFLSGILLSSRAQAEAVTRKGP